METAHPATRNSRIILTIPGSVQTETSANKIEAHGRDIGRVLNNQNMCINRDKWVVYHTEEYRRALLLV